MNPNDAWVEFLAKLSEKGIPLDRIFMPLEERGIPSLYVLIGVVLLIIAGGWFALSGGLGGGQATTSVTINVKSNGELLEGASLSVFVNGELAKSLKTSGSPVELEVNEGDSLRVKISKEGCEDYVANFTATAGMVINANLNCGVGGECIEEAKKLKLARIYVDDAFGRDCDVLVKDESGKPVDLGWTLIRGNKIVLSYDKDNCPRPGYSVDIKCQGAIKSFSIEDFISAAKSGKIKLKSSGGGGGAPQNNAELVDNIYISVKSEDGSAVSGIKVTATDASGNELNLGYSNVVSTAVSDYMGNAMLVLPHGQKFYLKGTDPTGNRPPTGILGPYTSENGMQLSLTIKSGFDSTITVKDDSGNAVPFARVLIYSSNQLLGEYQSDTGGIITLKLDKGTYKAIGIKEGYAIGREDFQAGQNVDLTLVKLGTNNSGSVVAHVINANTQNPMPGVTVNLETTDGLVVKVRQTNEDGYIDFGLVGIGSYILHIPATDTNLESDEYSQVFYVNASQAQTIEMSITPPQAILDITTNVKGYPKDGVYVEVYDVTYNRFFPMLIDAGESEFPGKLTLSVDRGSKIYLKASFTDEKGRVYGPVITDVFTANSNVQITINLTEMTLNQTASIEGSSLIDGKYSVESGKNFYLSMPINLPYYDEQSETPFDEVIVEVMVGELGSLDDADKTPLAITDLYAIDLNNQQELAFSVEKSDKMTSWDGPDSTVEDTEMSRAKYAKITINSYSEKMVYTLKIPISAMLVKTAKETSIFFRTTWIKHTDEGDVVYKSKEGGKWDSLPVIITPADQSWKLLVSNNPYGFYGYKAWFSTDEAGTLPTRTLVDKEYIYLHISAMASKTMSSFYIPIESTFDLADVSVVEVKVNGNPSDGNVQKTSPQSYSVQGGEVSTGDRVDVTLKVKLDLGISSGETTGSVKIFADSVNTIDLTILAGGDRIVTPVNDVVGSISVWRYGIGGWLLQDDIIDAFRQSNGKWVANPLFMSITFENLAEEEKNFSFQISSPNVQIIAYNDSIQATAPSNYPINYDNWTSVNSTSFKVNVSLPPEGIQTIVLVANGTSFDGKAKNMSFTVNEKEWVSKLVTHAWLDFNITSVVRGDEYPYLVFGADYIKVRLAKWYKNENGVNKTETIVPDVYWTLSKTALGRTITITPTGDYFKVTDVILSLDFSISNSVFKLEKSYEPPFLSAPQQFSVLTGNKEVTIATQGPRNVNISAYILYPMPSGIETDIKIDGISRQSMISKTGSAIVDLTIRVTNSNVQTINWLIIDVKDLTGKLLFTGQYQFSVLPSQTVVSSNKFVRESKYPEDILAEGGCELSNGKICDADQIVAYIGYIINDVENSDTHSGVYGPVGLGKENLNTKTIKDMLAELGKEMTVCSPNEDAGCGKRGERELILNTTLLSCGKLSFTGVLTPQGDINIKVSNKDGPWCDDLSTHNGLALLGMLNYDGLSRSESLISTSHFELGGDADKLIEGLSNIRALEDTFGSYSGVSSDDWSALTTGLNPAYTINYYETDKIPAGTFKCDSTTGDYFYILDNGNSVSIYVNSTAIGSVEGANQNVLTFLYNWLTGQTGCMVYRIPVDITEMSGNELFDYQVKITLDTKTPISEGKMNSDCSDIRIRDANGNDLPYWIEPGTCDTTETVIWTKLDLPASSTKTIYVYYGNPDLASESDGNSVFILFKDFDGTLGGWNEIKSPEIGGWTDSNGSVYTYFGKDDDTARIYTSVSLERPFIIESKGYATLSDNEGCEDDYDYIIFLGHSAPSISDYEFDFAHNNTKLGIKVNVSGNYNKVYTDKIGNWDEIYIRGKAVLTTSDITIYSKFTDSDWFSISVNDENYSSFTTLGFTLLDGKAFIDWIFVRKYASSEPLVDVGSEEAVSEIYD